MTKSKSRASRNASYVLHVFTASGAVVGLLALQAVIDGRVRDALVWLVVALLLDGLDGPIARKLDVVLHAPRLDGQMLDLVVDYVTYVVVPVVFLWNLELLPKNLEFLIGGSILLLSAIWFARIDQKTSDSWFSGFPAVWNLVVHTFILLGSSQLEVAIFSIILLILQMTSIKFIHPVRVKALRPLTITITSLYFLAIAYFSWTYPGVAGESISLIGKVILLGFPVYVMLLAIWRTWFSSVRIPILGKIV
ncbi:MAG: CDP-alcohol phosphatidyltransferase family protein [Candidatus Nanopelagicales bacterium]